MWGDTLLAAERAHLLRLLVWGLMSLSTGVILLAVFAVRRSWPPLLAYFALQMAGWGSVEAAVASLERIASAQRDYAGAVQLANTLWLSLGLDLGYIAVGATIVLAGWTYGRRLGAIGSGTGILVQGAALFALHGYFLSFLARAM